MEDLDAAVMEGQSQTWNQNRTLEILLSLTSDDISTFSFSPSPGQNLVSDATFRSVLEMEMGSLGRATADTRSRSLVVVRILHFRMVGCFSPTEVRYRRSEVRLSDTLIPALPYHQVDQVLTDW